MSGRKVKQSSIVNRTGGVETDDGRTLYVFCSASADTAFLDSIVTSALRFITFHNCWTLQVYCVFWSETSSHILLNLYSLWPLSPSRRLRVVQYCVSVSRCRSLFGAFAVGCAFLGLFLAEGNGFSPLLLPHVVSLLHFLLPLLLEPTQWASGVYFGEMTNVALRYGFDAEVYMRVWYLLPCSNSCVDESKGRPRIREENWSLDRKRYRPWKVDQHLGFVCLLERWFGPLPVR